MVALPFLLKYAHIMHEQANIKAFIKNYWEVALWFVVWVGLILGPDIANILHSPITLLPFALGAPFTIIWASVKSRYIQSQSKSPLPHTAGYRRARFVLSGVLLLSSGALLYLHKENLAAELPMVVLFLGCIRVFYLKSELDRLLRK
jgi:hypothetical protein